MIKTKKNNTKMICVNDINRIILKLSNFYDKEDVKNWGNSIILKINNLFKKYNVSDFEVNNNSYMGIVIECESITHGYIYIKAVPPMINRFENEIRTLKYLPDTLICKFYEINYDDKILVMENCFDGNKNSETTQLEKIFTDLQFSENESKAMKEVIESYEKDSWIRSNSFGTKMKNMIKTFAYKGKKVKSQTKLFEKLEEKKIIETKKEGTVDY
mgnify:CR=1 FL=1